MAGQGTIPRVSRLAHSSLPVPVSQTMTMLLALLVFAKATTAGASSGASNTTTVPRSLQQQLTMCLRRRDGRFVMDTRVVPSQVETFRFQGGGFPGERVPYRNDALWLFDENDCQPRRATPSCPSDVQPCPDGTSVKRDPNRNCEFAPCNQSPSGAIDCTTCPCGYFDGCKSSHSGRKGEQSHPSTHLLYC